MADEDEKMGLRGKVTDAFDRELGIPVEEKKPEPQPEPDLQEASADEDLQASAKEADPRGLGFDDVGEGTPTGEMHTQTAAERKAQNRRNAAIAFSVLGFVILVYLTTFFRLAENLKTVAS